MKRFSRRKLEKQQKRERELIDAVKDNDAQRVLKLLRKGVSPNGGPDSCAFSQSPLSLACQLGHVDTAHALIQYGADVNEDASSTAAAAARNHRRGTSPVVAAVDSGCLELLQLLLSRHASLHVSFHCYPVNAKVNLLHFACIRGRRAFIRHLVENGCDIEAESSRGQRAIHYAVQFDQTDVIDELSNCKASLNARDGSASGNTPLHLAVIHNSYAVVKCLVQLHVNISARNKHGQTAIDIARDNDFDRIHALLQHTQSELQFKQNIERLTHASSETQQRLCRVEDATSRLQGDMTSRITHEVDARFKQLLSCLRSRTPRNSVDWSAPPFAELNVSQRSDYASMEALIESSEEFPGLESPPPPAPPARAHSYAQLSTYEQRNRRYSGACACAVIV